MHDAGGAAGRLLARIEVGDRVWLDIQKVLHHNIFEERCWIKCMSLDILEQTDPVDCKLRPQEGTNWHGINYGYPDPDPSHARTSTRKSFLYAASSMF